MLTICFHDCNTIQNDVTLTIPDNRTHAQPFVREFLQNDYFRFDCFPKIDGFLKVIRLRAIDGAETRKFLANQCGNKGGKMDSMGNALLEHRSGRGLVADVERIGITNQSGKSAYDILRNQRHSPGLIPNVDLIVRDIKGVSHRRDPT